MSEIVRWELPPPGKNRGRWQRIADELRGCPHEWALVAESVDEQIAYGSISRTFRREGCAVRTRILNGRVSVWACWEPQ